jgi:succinyl-diaminopimelate desuccinylase
MSNVPHPLADPVPLAQALLRCASVTPADAGAQTVLAEALEALGFVVTRLRFGAIENLYARIGTEGPHICFAGHTDVVPEGAAAAWTAGPFDGDIRDGVLFGRGACDMKGAIAAFVAATAAHLNGRAPKGSISFLITGDEEGPAVDGTVKVLEWMRDNGQIPDFCLVGEPTNPTRLGDVIKIGRRGSLNATITIHGTQGHAAYPQRADNPCHRLVRVLAALTAAPVDAGSQWFEPTTLQVTSILREAFSRLISFGAGTTSTSATSPSGTSMPPGISIGRRFNAWTSVRRDSSPQTTTLKIFWS